MTIVETGDDGCLHVPAGLLAGAKPHTKFILDSYGELIVLRPAEESTASWINANPAQRAESIMRWAEIPRPPAPDLSDEMLRREHLYD